MSAQLLSQGQKALEQYLEKEIPDEQLVPGPVANSWQRCCGSSTLASEHIELPGNGTRPGAVGEGTMHHRKTRPRGARP